MFVQARRMLHEVLDREVGRAQRYGRALSVMVIDLDDLSTLNARHGRAFGDRILLHSARVISESVRREDTVVRTSGDAWAVALPETSRRGARDLAERLRALISAAVFEAEDEPASVGCSIGVAELDQESSGAELLAAADRALGEAKRAGRGIIRLAVAAF
jgi:diguanylate cyclase (GGDEF)-like protein